MASKEDGRVYCPKCDQWKFPGHLVCNREVYRPDERTQRQFDLDVAIARGYEPGDQIGLDALEGADRDE